MSTDAALPVVDWAHGDSIVSQHVDAEEDSIPSFLKGYSPCPGYTTRIIKRTDPGSRLQRGVSSGGLANFRVMSRSVEGSSNTTHKDRRLAACRGLRMSRCSVRHAGFTVQIGRTKSRDLIVVTNAGVGSRHSVEHINAGR